MRAEPRTTRVSNATPTSDDKLYTAPSVPPFATNRTCEPPSLPEFQAGQASLRPSESRAHPQSHRLGNAQSRRSPLTRLAQKSGAPLFVSSASNSRRRTTATFPASLTAIDGTPRSSIAMPPDRSTSNTCATHSWHASVESALPSSHSSRDASTRPSPQRGATQSPATQTWSSSPQARPSSTGSKRHSPSTHTACSQGARGTHVHSADVSDPES